MKTIVRIFGKSLIIVTFFYLQQTEQVFSQINCWTKKPISYGIQIEEVLNGSGHGLLTNVDLILKIGKSEIGAGLFAQSMDKKLSGLSFQFKYFITSDLYTNFYTHFTSMFHYQNCLNDNLNEQFHPQDYSNCCQYEKFNTFNNTVGIGLETMTLKNLYIDARIGVGGYSSTVCGEDTRNGNVIGREDIGVAIMASIGILYRISTTDKKRKLGK